MRRCITASRRATYSIVVRDRSKLHNFHLVGKGVNKKSTVAGTGTTTWKLTLARGRSASTPTGAEDRQGLGHRHLDAPAGLDQPGVLAAGARISAWRSSSAFSSAPKRSANAE